MATEFKDMQPDERLTDTIQLCKDAEFGYADVDNRLFYERVNWLLEERGRLLGENVVLTTELRAAASKIDRRDELLASKDEAAANLRSEVAGLKTRLAELETRYVPLRDDSIKQTPLSSKEQEQLAESMTQEGYK